MSTPEGTWWFVYCPDDGWRSDTDETTTYDDPLRAGLDAAAWDADRPGFEHEVWISEPGIGGKRNEHPA